MSLYVARLTRVSRKEGKMTILINKMDIERFMFYVQQVDKEKLRDIDEFINKKAKTHSESRQQRSNVKYSYFQ